MVISEEHKQKLKEGRERAREVKAQQPMETDTVVIEKSFLEDIRKRMTVLEEDNAMLKQVADRAKMSDYFIKHREKMPLQYKLRTVTDKDQEKVILAWTKMKFNDVYVDGKKEISNQVIILILEDGTSKEMSYQDFVRLYSVVQCSKIEDRTNEKGNLILKLQRNDNKKVYEIDIRFVN